MSSPTIALGDVATFVRGVTFKPENVAPPDGVGTVACMRTKNVQEQLDITDVWGIPRSLVRRADQYLITGDTLVSSANSWNLVGKCCLVPDLSEPTTFGGFVSVLRADAERLEPRYLFHWFSSPRVQQLVRSFGRKTTSISNLDLARCRQLKIPLPPLGEQRRIARALDAADALRRTRSRTIAGFESLVSSLFAEMFVLGVGGGWPETSVSDLADYARGGIRTGPFGSQLLHSEFVDDGVAVLGIDNAVANEFRWARPRHITETKYAALTRYTVNPGDVLITIMGTCGRAAVVPEDVPAAISTKHLCCITLDRERCLPTFLHAYFLRHPGARSYLLSRAKGAIMSGLNMGIIRGLPVRLPPLAMQSEYARRIECVGVAKLAAMRHRHQLDVLFASLQHDVFGGAV